MGQGISLFPLHLQAPWHKYSSFSSQVMESDRDHKCQSSQDPPQPSGGSLTHPEGPKLAFLFSAKNRKVQIFSLPVALEGWRGHEPPPWLSIKNQCFWLWPKNSFNHVQRTSGGEIPGFDYPQIWKLIPWKFWGATCSTSAYPKY